MIALSPCSFRRLVHSNFLELFSSHFPLQLLMKALKMTPTAKEMINRQHLRVQILGLSQILGWPEREREEGRERRGQNKITGKTQTQSVRQRAKYNARRDWGEEEMGKDDE